MFPARPVVITVFNESFETTVNAIPDPDNASYLGEDPRTLFGSPFGCDFESVFNSAGVITSGLTGYHAIFINGHLRQDTGAAFRAGVTNTLQASSDLLL